MSKLVIIEDAVNNLSDAISRLLACCSFAPVWNDHIGWRHRDEHKEVSLYWLTKLAGISSTLHACVKLAVDGYWFQVAILARTATEAQLSIAFTLPKADMKSGEWPSKKQKEAIENHFKETWDDPDSPYENDRLRPNIRDLAASIGHFQHKASALNPHDTSQTAIQWMRFLSDYTHMAYPQLMELLEEGHGYVLTANQKRSSFGEGELGHLLSSSYAYAEIITVLLGKIISSYGEKAKSENASKEKQKLFQEKQNKITEIFNILVEKGKTVGSHFPASDDEVKRTLRSFKKS